MWKSRYKIFIMNFNSINGFRKKTYYVIWALRKLIQVLLLELAGRVNNTPISQSGVAANVAFPSGIEKANLLGYVYNNRLKLSVGNHKPHINITIPSITPGIIFGGYISIFSLAARLIEKGFPIRFIVTENMPFTKAKLQEQLVGYPAVCYSLQHADVISAIPTTSYKPIPVSKKDIFIAYSAFTALLCHHASKEIGQNKFLFYIQEEEGVFHSNNSFKSTIEYIYTLPHVAIFNSNFLEKYFKLNQLGMFGPGVEKNNSIHTHLTFKHALNNHRIPTRHEMAARIPKKLLFFARPEQHAERNLFEVGLVALRICCEQNIFKKGEWEFHAIGAMDTDFSLVLGNGHVLEFLPRLPLDAYAELLQGYDIGISLMFAPHPSVPNFEMAAAGIVTVTTTFVNRSKKEMEDICPNFIAVPPHIEGVTQGIKDALDRVYHFDDRIENAKFNWPRHWDESFNDIWLNHFKQLINSNFHKNPLPSSIVSDEPTRVEV